MVERKNGKTAVEIIEYFKSGESHPNEIFQIYEELSKFSEKEIEEAIKETRIGDAIGMSYITAIEMKKMEDGIHIWKSGRRIKTKQEENGWKSIYMSAD